MALKRCRECDRVLPLTPKYFHRHQGRADGFRENCRACRNVQRQRDRREQHHRAERTVVLRLAKMIREGREVPNVRALFFEAFHLFGGVSGVAKAIRRQYDAAKPGSMVRVNLLLGIARLAIEQAKRPPEEDEFNPSALSKEELEAAIQQRFKLLVDLQMAGS